MKPDRGMNGWMSAWQKEPDWSRAISSTIRLLTRIRSAWRALLPAEQRTPPSIHPSIPSQTHRFHPRPWVAGSQHTLRAMCLTGVLFACVRVCGCGRHGRLKRDAREPGNAEAGACLRMTQVHSPHSRMARSLIPGDRDFSQVSRPFVLPGADFAGGKISLRTRWKSGESVWRFVWRWMWR